MDREHCIWRRDDDDRNTWATQCGEVWELMNGTPGENKMKYCLYCGQPIKVESEVR
jgi:hypothetical protein